MKIKHTGILLAVALMVGFGMTPRVSAQANTNMVFQDNFEPGQWTNWSVVSAALPPGTADATKNVLPAGSGNSILMTNTQCRLHRNLIADNGGVEVAGPAVVSMFLYYDSSQTRMTASVRGYSGTGVSNEGGSSMTNGAWQFMADFGWYNSATLPGETYVSTKYQGRINFLTNSGTPVFFSLTNGPNRAVGWHRFDLVRAADTNHYRYYVDGIMSRDLYDVVDKTWDTLFLGMGLVSSAGGGNTWFDGVKVEKLIPPEILLGPVSQVAAPGTTVSLSCLATNHCSVTNRVWYQWLLGGTNLAGATNATYTKVNVQAAHAGDYQVVVSDYYGVFAVTSAAATLTLMVPPTILVPPAGLHTNAGAVVQLSVLAEGSAPLSYRWARNGANLIDDGRVLGATNATLVLTNLQFSEAGLYTVIVSNMAGAVTSAPPALLSLASARLHSGAWSNGLFQLNLTGVTNQRLELQVCTNLPRPGQTSHWVTVQALTNRAGTMLYQDPSPRLPHRFYRVVAP